MTYKHVKRALDCVGAIAGLIILSPLLGVIAVFVIILMGRPVIFTQERVTLDGRVFRIRKFRSMRHADRPQSSRSDHERLTRFGRLLRSTSLDELPSLWNVVTGDLSIVGPRPLRPIYLPLYTDRQHRRHEVRGGLTGLAQVNGRNALSWDDKFDFDVSYVDRMGPLLDFTILLRTIGTVLGRRGVSKADEATTDSYGGTLRSRLVELRPRAGSAGSQSWEVFAVRGQRLGTAEIAMPDRLSALIRFDRELDRDEECDDDDQLFAEVLRLLTNRARGMDAATAVCHLTDDGAEMKHCASLGYTPVPEGEFEELRTPSDGSHDIVLGCRLWPDETLEKPRTSPL